MLITLTLKRAAAISPGDIITLTNPKGREFPKLRVLKAKGRSVECEEVAPELEKRRKH